jgi:nitric oxide reductase NorE protein
MSGTRSVIPRAPATDQAEAAGWGPLSDLPGNPMMWILILGELAVFGALFVGFAVARALDPATFDASQAQLDRLLGGLNTVVLVTSGGLAALAVQRKTAGRSPRLPLLAAIAVGSLFLAVKVVEYHADFVAGFGIDTNRFWELYFLLTGFHALHVVLGLIVLAVVTVWDSLENLETGTAFWHMVDLIWVLLYPLVYLLR